MDQPLEASGFGRILLKGEVVADVVRYSVSFSRPVVRGRKAARSNEVASPYSGRGQLLSDFPVRLIGKDIELELSDGRRWPCFIQGGDGTLEGRGSPTS